jgi:hypothetical protein
MIFAEALNVVENARRSGTESGWASAHIKSGKPSKNGTLHCPSKKIDEGFDRHSSRDQWGGEAELLRLIA